MKGAAFDFIVVGAGMAGLPREARATRLDAGQAEALVPVFKPGYLGGALFDAHSADIDVSTVLQGYATQCRQRAVHLDLDSTVVSIDRTQGAWNVHTTNGSYSAPVVVNAGGAWGDQLAELAGVRPAGLVSKRRTAVLIEVPNGAKADARSSWGLDVGALAADRGSLFASSACEAT